jgi:GT2 family glycosyltransferase
LEISIKASIVLYNTNHGQLRRIIDDLFSARPEIYLYLIDNSPKDELRGVADHNSRIEYIHNPSNPGFGAAHNVAIDKAISNGGKFHFIVNPDTYFEGDVLTPMIQFMEKDRSIGMMMPEILNPDGSIQNLPKLLPNPFSIILRKIKSPQMVYERFINKYELRFVPRRQIYNVPILSGCFTLLNLDAIKEIGKYDDKYFMYFEDWDLSRRMHVRYKTLYFPKVSVYHEYDSGANKSLKLFKIFLLSTLTYFNKWGWIIDPQRRQLNKQVLSQFNRQQQ